MNTEFWIFVTIWYLCCGISFMFVGQQPGTPCIFDPNSQGQVLCGGQCSLRQDTYGRRGHSFGAAGGGLSDRTFPGSQQDFWSSVHCPFAMLILVFFGGGRGYVWQERNVWTGTNRGESGWVEYVSLVKMHIDIQIHLCFIPTSSCFWVICRQRPIVL